MTDTITPAPELPTGLPELLPAPLAAALADKGYATLTAVQSAVLAPDLTGQDLLVSAQTGSGKTVAFGMAMAGDLMGDADFLPPPDAPRALIIAPTRELALQVRREFEWLYARTGAAIASCVGGMDARTERRALDRGAHIVVGTPGRLRDHIERGALDLSALRVAVMDEADEMLDLGFREDLEFILEAAPSERRTLLFSATVSPGIERLATSYQRSARRIATTAARSQHVDIEYQALMVDPADSENAIVNVLRYHEARNALVFCKTRAMVNHLTARLLNRGFSVVPLSGELAQEERARALQAMRDGRARVCVATDVAARGIDLPGLELVIHAELPSNRETLLHRSGRTGRAGSKGVSALIVPLNARKRTERLLAMANVRAEWRSAPTAEDVSARDRERLFNDAVLHDAETADEHTLVNLLIERFTPRELAAGVLRQYMSARSAPEDVAPVTADGPKPRARADFDRAVWVRLSMGADGGAEARWLLPMLCRVGNLGKGDIGAIRVYDGHTLVQLHADVEARFFAALGEGAEMEQGITAVRAEAPDPGAPTARRIPREGDARPPRADGPRKPYEKRDGDAPRPRRADADHPAPQAAGQTDDARPAGGAAARDGDAPRKPYAPRDGDAPRKPYAPRDGDAPRKPYAPRDGDAPRKPYAPRDGDAPRKPYAPRDGDAPRKPYAPRDGDAPRKPYAPRDGDAPRKPYAPRDGDAPRKPYAPRDGDAPRKPYAPRDGDAPRKPYAPRDGDAPRKPFVKRDGDAPRKPRAETAPAAPAKPRFDPALLSNPSARLDGRKPGAAAAGKGFGKGSGKGGPGKGPGKGPKPGGKPRPMGADARPMRPRKP